MNTAKSQMMVIRGIMGLAEGDRSHRSAEEAGGTNVEETAPNARRLVRKQRWGSKYLTAYTGNYTAAAQSEGATLATAERSQLQTWATAGAHSQDKAWGLLLRSVVAICVRTCLSLLLFHIPIWPCCDAAVLVKKSQETSNLAQLEAVQRPGREPQASNTPENGYQHFNH